VIDVSSLYDVFWLVIGLGLVAYVLTGGADLGAGLWDLLASGPRREAQRRAIKHAIAPIWEANHVWLIFVIVVMFSAFPRAFATIATALHIPIGLALIGLVFRGAAFVFHAYGIQADRARDAWASLFAWSSLVAPFFLGTVIAALASGEVRVYEGRVISGFFAGWTGAFALLVGLFALALCAMLAACYLVAETDAELAEDFSRRAMFAELAAGPLAFAVLALASRQAPLLFENLIKPVPIIVQVAAALAAGTTLLLLRGTRRRFARYSAALQVALVLIGWGLAMDRHFILDTLPIAAAGTQPSVLPALLLALSLGAMLLAPALWYLFRVFKLKSNTK
jgi:cytochrome bd ubiquinol oxidase subunit II